MVDETFETFVARERARLHGERDAIFTQQHELEEKLGAVNRELAAIEAYEAAKTGKAPARQPATRRTGTRKTSGTRSGSKRNELLKLIQGNDGLTRAQILDKMGLKGNKSGEMSVSNALTALTKGNQVTRRDRKYVAA
jgi:hypothetical protein